ncbi:Pycsar system effector family protein [Nonomuraea typhae]|uniref:Pycsar system effector family protein n=1 Tax=Nonomuraea typhae TaxID=2603600 RepID=UPI0012FC8D4D|nr:Pycsar system effector family protein [Nonomuraea typhae]
MTDDLGTRHRPSPPRRTMTYLTPVPDSPEPRDTAAPDSGSHLPTAFPSSMTDPDRQRELWHMDNDSAAQLADEVDAVRGELGRADAKAGMLLQLAAGAAALVGALTTAAASHLPAAAQAGCWLGTALLAAAVAVLLGVVGPDLPRRGQLGYGFCAYATATGPEELLGMVASGEDRLATTLISLSQLAWIKYRRVRWAVRLLHAALAILILAVALAAL